MPDAPVSLLLATAVSTALVHTFIPDHWLPFVLIGRSRGWSAGRTAAISGASALLHTTLSAALALVALRLGLGAAHALGERLETLSGAMLIAFGVVYAGWAWRKGGHFHPGGHLAHEAAEPVTCEGQEGPVHPDHLHYHADEAWIAGRAERSGVYLAVIVGANPCVLLLPIVLATAERGASAVTLVTLSYGVTTTALMVGLSVAGVVGARRIPVPAVARHMETFSGLLIAAVGLVFLLLEG